MTATPKLAHVVFQTSQPEAMTKWYCDLLHAHVVYEGKGLTFMTFDEEHHRIALLTSPTPLERKDPGQAWMHHSAFTFESLDDLLERYLELKELGVEPAMPIQHGVTTSLYYEDPDGNFVEMQVDNFAHAQEATDYMNGAEYDEDPRGPLFDPGAAVEARRAGSPAAEIQTRAWAKAHPSLDHVAIG